MRMSTKTVSHHTPALASIARWMLYASGASAVLLGFVVWPGRVHAAGGVHGLFGWLALLSLWTLAGLAARAHVPRGVVWSAAGWGIVTALGASAQYQMRAGSWITIVHVATALGAVGFGHHLYARIRDGACSPAEGLPIKDAAAEFLALKRIAITGVSRKPASHGANIVHQRLRERGYEVFAVNPNATEIEGVHCFANLASIPGGVDGVVIATRPERAMETMRECAELGITHVWMHRSIDRGSVSEEATAWGRARGIHVIDGGCPLMFDPVADPAHKMMRPLLTLGGRVPRRA
jgi:predicted CoA-binding protein